MKTRLSAYVKTVKSIFSIDIMISRRIPSALQRLHDCPTRHGVRTEKKNNKKKIIIILNIFFFLYPRLSNRRSIQTSKNTGTKLFSRCTAIYARD